MAPWTPFPHAGDYAWDTTRVQQQWSQLHLGDVEPLPQDPAVLHAWALFHNGEFQKAAEAGLAAGGAGITAANKATAVYATYLEPREQTRLGLFMQIAERAQAQAAANAQHANAWYWNAYALGRYCQGISVAKALAQGAGPAGQGIARKSHCPLAPACGSAHCAGHLPRRSHRQSGGDGGRHDLWRQERSLPAAV